MLSVCGEHMLHHAWRSKSLVQYGGWGAVYFLLMSGDIISCLITISRRRPSADQEEGRRTHMRITHVDQAEAKVDSSLVRRRSPLGRLPRRASLRPSVRLSLRLSLSLSVLPYVCLNRFLDFVFLIVNTLFPRLHLRLSVAVSALASCTNSDDLSKSLRSSYLQFMLLSCFHRISYVCAISLTLASNCCRSPSAKG